MFILNLILFNLFETPNRMQMFTREVGVNLIPLQDFEMKKDVLSK